MRIAQNIVQLKTSLPQGVTLVAVSKFPGGGSMGGLQRRTAGVWRKQGTGTERQAKSTT